MEKLGLDYTAVSDKGVDDIAGGLPDITGLRLDSGNITDASVPALSKLKALRELNLYHTLVSQAGYDQLKSALPKCRIIWDRDSSMPTRRKS